MLGHEIVEVQRPFLGGRVLGRADREDLPPHDSCFDLGAGVDADGGRRMVEGVEVVVLRASVDRVGPFSWPEHHVGELSEVEALPSAHVIAGMGTHENAAVTQPAIGRRTERLHPLLDEVCLARRDELRRAEIEQVRLLRGQPDLPAELLASRAGPAGEPLVVTGRAGGHDGLPLDPVHGLGFAHLRVVPHEHAVRSDVNQPLVRQVVPAVHAERAWNRQRPRRLDVFLLRRAKVDERRHEKQIGRLTLHGPEHEWIDWNRPFDEPQNARQYCQCGARVETPETRAGAVSREAHAVRPCRAGREHPDTPALDNACSRQLPGSCGRGSSTGARPCRAAPYG